MVGRRPTAAPGMISGVIVGRTKELDRLAELLDGLDRGEGAMVVVTGEPGIGKTTVLDWVAANTTRRVVRITGHETDRQIAVAGLHALRRAVSRLGVDVSDPVAIDVEAAPSPLALANATLALLDAAGAGTVVLVDDVQWLDASSADALGFALRRLRDESVLAVVARRSGTDGPDLTDQHTVVLELSGLSTSDAVLLLGDGTSDAVAERCVAATGGNPLGLGEMRRNLDAEQRSGRAPLPDDLPVGGRLTAEYMRRVRSLPALTQRALHLLAVGGDDASADIVRALGGGGQLASALVVAETSGLVVLRGGSIRVQHPLVRSAIVEAAGAAAIRDAHRTLASIVTDELRRARHLASSAEVPDEAIAATLDDAARTMRSRGAPALAATTWQHAADLSTDDLARQRRLADAGAAWWDASDEAAAMRATADALASPALLPEVRAAAIGVRAEVIGWLHDSSAAAELLAATAADVSSSLPAMAATMLMRASLHAGLADRARAARQHAEAACELVAADPALLLGGRAVRSLARQRCGERDASEHDVAASLILADLPVELLGPALAALQALGLALLAQERWSDAERVLVQAIRAARVHGLDGTLNFSSAVLAEVQARQGRLADAVATASVFSFVEGRHPAATAPFAMAVLARTEATLGRLDSAAAHAADALEVAVAVGLGTLEAWARAALGRVALARGAHGEAVTQLQAAADAHREVVDPGELWLEGDLGDALVAAGETREARRVADDLAVRAERCRSRWGRATAERLLGQIDRDATRLRVAADTAGEIGAPLEQARAVLALAELRGDEQLAAAAVTALSRLGATPWVDRARSSSNDRVEPGASPITDLLTDAELRVALAVAAGRSNLEAAGELFLSRRTVDAHLRRIYAKLSIRSRSELTAQIVRELG